MKKVLNNFIKKQWKFHRNKKLSVKMEGKKIPHSQIENFRDIVLHNNKQKQFQRQKKNKKNEN